MKAYHNWLELTGDHAIEVIKLTAMKVGFVSNKASIQALSSPCSLTICIAALAVILC